MYLNTSRKFYLCSESVAKNHDEKEGKSSKKEQGENS